MSTQAQTSGQTMRIDPEGFKVRMESGEPVTVLDARGHKDWEASAGKICGAIRVHAAHFQLDPSWPRDQLTVVY
jgi:predicted sulfurtransferase